MRPLLLIFSFGFLPYLAKAQCIVGDCLNNYSSYKFSDGGVYKGDFHEGKPHGQGTITYRDNSQYTGAWAKGTYNGYGTFTNADGKYEGHFNQGKFHGFGVFHFSNGDIYEGQWNNHKQHGFGIILKLDGAKFEGYFHHGQMHGPGTITHTDGRIFESVWQYGKLPSNSSRMVRHNNDFSFNCNEQYCHENTGTYQYENGNIYKGEFFDGRPKGSGQLIYPNGDIYNGEFSNDKPNGKGKKVFVDGGEIHGEFHNGNIVRTFTDFDVYPQDYYEDTQAADVDIYAVLVGVSAYPGDIDDILYADEDAMRMYFHLRSKEGGALQKSQIRLLTNQEATKDNILKATAEVFSQADENDMVIFYYSGHGQYNGFIPIDYHYGKLVNYQALSEIFKASKAKHKLIIADACRSGAMPDFTEKGIGERQEDINPNFYKHLYHSEPGYAFLLSSTSRELSYEHDPLRAGVFSYYLIKGIKGQANKNNDELISIAELYKFISSNVKRYTDGKQTPIIYGDFDGRTPISSMK